MRLCMDDDVACERKIKKNSKPIVGELCTRQIDFIIFSINNHNYCTYIF